MAVRLVQMILFTACVAVFWAVGLASFQASRFSACSKAAAWEAAKDGVRARLIAPKAAQFPGLSEVDLQRTGKCAWEVRGYVDAVNLHGVLLHADFALRVEAGAEVRLDALTTRPPLIEAQPLPQLAAAGG